MNVLPYHHPVDKQFSLVFVTDDRATFVDRLREERNKDDVDAKQFIDSVDGGTRYAVFTDTHRSADSVPSFDDTDELRRWLRSEFNDDLPVINAIYTFFDELMSTKREQGDPLEAYKQIELEKIPEILDSVEWRQTVPEVGAELLSEFVLTHPMPNTNHRTGIILLDRYLRSFDDEVSIPDTGETGEWYDWASNYVEDSKRLLTLRRRYRIFRYAEQLGYDTVKRKHGVMIPFEEYDIHRPDAFEHFTRAHLKRTERFVQTVLEKTEATHLLDVEDDGKRAFVSRL
jgi:prophage maintenance system killer protein